MLKRPKLPNGFQGSIFRQHLGVKAAGFMTFFSLIRCEVTVWCFRNLHHQLSSSKQSGVQCLCSAGSRHPPPEWGSQFLQNNWFQDLMKLRFLMSHRRKNSVRDKVIGKKWIYLEKSTFHRQCGPSPKVRKVYSFLFTTMSSLKRQTFNPLW